MIEMIIKRDGRKVPFNEEKISSAINKAFQASGSAKSLSVAQELAHQVVARINADEWNTSNHNYGSGGYNGNSFKVDSYQDLGVVDEFTFSGWVWVFDYVGTQPCIVSRKDGHEQPRGWELKLWGSDNRAALAPYGGGYTDDTGVHSTATQTTLKGGQLKGRGFVHLALAYRGTQLVVYENGSPIATNTIEESTNPTLPL